MFFFCAGPKPFVELSLLKTIAPHSRVEQYKYFKILIQEFSIKVDINVVFHWSEFSTIEEATDEANRNNFIKDIVYTKEPLLSHVTVISSLEQKNFYDLLHFSPLKVNTIFFRFFLVLKECFNYSNLNNFSRFTSVFLYLEITRLKVCRQQSVSCCRV